MFKLLMTGAFLLSNAAFASQQMKCYFVKSDNTCVDMQPMVGNQDEISIYKGTFDLDKTSGIIWVHAKMSDEGSSSKMLVEIFKGEGPVTSNSMNVTDGEIHSLVDAKFLSSSGLGIKVSCEGARSAAQQTELLSPKCK